MSAPTTGGVSGPSGSGPLPSGSACDAPTNIAEDRLPEMMLRAATRAPPMVTFGAVTRTPMPALPRAVVPLGADADEIAGDHRAGRGGDGTADAVDAAEGVSEVDADAVVPRDHVARLRDGAANEHVLDADVDAGAEVRRRGGPFGIALPAMFSPMKLPSTWEVAAELNTVPLSWCDVDADAVAAVAGDDVAGAGAAADDRPAVPPMVVRPFEVQARAAIRHGGQAVGADADVIALNRQVTG